MAVKFHDLLQPIKGIQKKLLSTFITAQVHHYLDGIKKIDLNYIFCDDHYLLEINQKFLNHDTYTDIITFDLSEKENELIGEIYISRERVIENAKKFNVTDLQELHRVVFHGVLHLCGFKDKTAMDKTEMTAAENRCLNLYFDTSNE
jgi:probable rRNA maturation factor